MSKPQEKCIAQSSSCHTKYRRYSHQRPEISTTSSSSLARSCAQSLAMTISSTRSIGLPENEVDSTIDTDVIKLSSGGSTERRLPWSNREIAPDSQCARHRTKAAHLKRMTQGKIRQTYPYSRKIRGLPRSGFQLLCVRVARARQELRSAIRALSHAVADLLARCAPSLPSP